MRAESVAVSEVHRNWGKEKNMRQVRWASVTIGLSILAVCWGMRPAAADIRSDEAAAIVQWPSVIYWDEPGAFVMDTIIQMSNTSADPVSVWCFYENANAHCTNTGIVCTAAADCCDATAGCGICMPEWNETDFHVNITPRQPVGWLASEGAAGYDAVPPKDFGTFALSGVGQNVGPKGSSNAGSRVPGVPEEPFNGSLRCIAVDAAGIPIDSNVLKGESTLVFISTVTPGDSAPIQVAKHNAIGVQAIPGMVDTDNVLCLGGDVSTECPDGAEYNGCPGVLILDHFFDFAVNPVMNEQVTTDLTLIPCSQDYLRQAPGASVVQYLVFNEYEQRYSTSRPIQCKERRQLSEIDTTQPGRSIFSAGVAGTLTGQTRIQGVNPLGNGGILGVATETHGLGPEGLASGDYAEFNLHFQGSRAQGDHIVLP